MKRLTIERKKRGLNLTAMSRVLRVHPSWLSNVEHGRWVPAPTSPAAKRLVKFLGLPLEELLAEVEPTLEPAGMTAPGERMAAAAKR